MHATDTTATLNGHKLAVIASKRFIQTIAYAINVFLVEMGYQLLCQMS